MKNLKPSVDILEGLTTGFNMDVSAPHLVQNGSLATVALVDAV
jgi:hypothetical protein